MSYASRFAAIVAVASVSLILVSMITTYAVVRAAIHTLAANEFERNAKSIIDASAGDASATKVCGLIRGSLRTTVSSTSREASVVDRRGNERCRSDMRQPAVPKSVRQGDAYESLVLYARGDGGHGYAYRTRLDDTAVLVLSRDAVQDAALLRSLSLAMIGLVVLWSIVAVIVGLRVGDSATRPVVALTAYARRRAQGEIRTAQAGERFTGEIEELRAALDASIDALESAVGVRRQLVIDAAHELRTPLTSALANAQLAQRADVSDDERAEILNDLNTQLARLRQIVDQLVELAAIDDRQAMDGAEERLGDIVEAACQRARELHPGLTLHVNVDASVLTCNRHYVERALGTLIDNVAAHAGQRSQVWVDQQGPRIVVADDGPGFDTSVLEQALEPFHRADAQSLGHGLGLALVAAVARAHDGSVVLGARHGGGASVTLVLGKLTDSSQALPRVVVDDEVSNTNTVA